MAENKTQPGGASIGQMTRRQAGRLVALAGCGLACSPVTARFAVGGHPQASRRAELDALLEDVRRQHQLPGLAAAVVSGSRGTVSGVAGVRRWGSQARIQIDDRFHIASCTKSWTATLSALSVASGRLQWTTTLAEGLPNLAARMRKEYASATLEQLLAHEARLPAYTQPSALQVGQMQALTGTSAEQRLAFLAQVLTEAPNSATGEGAYSNAGYAAVGALLEAATGSSWEELIRRELTQPLKLTTVGFGYPATVTVPNQPRGHARQGGATVELPLDEARQLPVCLWPAGAVHCSIGDLATYAGDHLNGLRHRSALLPSAHYQRLHRRRGESVFTLGWGIAHDPRWGVTHFGAGSGGWFFVRIVIVPEHDAAVVIAANSGNASVATRELWPELVRRFGMG
jgi:CubicO group peptidase (beta-lactamase class C family)